MWTFYCIGVNALFQCGAHSCPRLLDCYTVLNIFESSSSLVNFSRIRVGKLFLYAGRFFVSTPTSVVGSPKTVIDNMYMKNVVVFQ